MKNLKKLRAMYAELFRAQTETINIMEHAIDRLKRAHKLAEEIYIQDEPYPFASLRLCRRPDGGQDESLD